MPPPRMPRPCLALARSLGDHAAALPQPAAASTGGGRLRQPCPAWAKPGPGPVRLAETQITSPDTTVDCNGSLPETCRSL